MHEASIAQHIIDGIIAQVEQGTIPPGKVVHIHIKVGKMTAVVADNLKFMFEVLARDTVLHQTSLEIIEVPIQCHCSDCNTVFSPEELSFWCNNCGSPKVEIIAGRELLIDSVEVSNDNEES